MSLSSREKQRQIEWKKNTDFLSQEAKRPGLFRGKMVGPPLSYSIFMVGTVVAISSFLAMNFTGASTFTSLSGVKQEMRYSLPFQAGMIVVAIVGRIIAEVLSKGGGGV